jgi:hypothetical protein
MELPRVLAGFSSLTSGASYSRSTKEPEEVWKTPFLNGDHPKTKLIDLKRPEWNLKPVE